MLAFPARHVIAAAVLLDRRIALWTFLGVGRDPVGRFRVIFALLQPLFHETARRRLVVGQRAPETEAMFAEAVDGRHNSIELPLLDTTFDCIYTLRSGAPLQAFLVVDIAPREEDLVPE